MTGWIKYYADGTNYIGDDHKVSTRLASWQNSKNKNIIAVDLYSFDNHLKIIGTGDYWQSDTYETVFPYSVPSLKKRRIMKKINFYDSFFKEYRTNNELIIYFNSNLDKGKYNKIYNIHYNKWLVLEHCVQKKSIMFYFKENKF